MQEARTEVVQRGDKSSLHIQFDGFYLTRGHYSNNSSATLHDAKTGKIIAYPHRQSAAKVLTGKGQAVEQPGQQCLGTRPLKIRSPLPVPRKKKFSPREIIVVAVFKNNSKEHHIFSEFKHGFCDKMKNKKNMRKRVVKEAQFPFSFF